MLFVRLISLIISTAFLGVLVAAFKSGGNNDTAQFVFFLMLIPPVLIYFLPTYEAWNNKNKNLTSIFILNFFLGWTILGWVLSLTWAYKSGEDDSKDGVAKAPTPPQATKRCPYCAEEVLVEAIKCKHCGSALSPGATAKNTLSGDEESPSL